MSAITSTALRDNVSRLEITTRVTLGVLAFASGIYTYLGVRELLNGDGVMPVVAALVYSVAVSVGIFAFWSFLMRLLPHVLDATGRLLLFGTMVLGSLMIVAMSAWLNATALAGAAALEQHLGNALQDYTRELDRANRYALSAQGLLPDIQLATRRFASLADSEKTGGLSGSTGSGAVFQLLNQMSTQLNNLSQEVAKSSDRARALYEEGTKHLSAMRELVSSKAPIAGRSDAFGSEATALLGVVAALQQTSVAPAVKRAADDLGKSFVAPSAGRGAVGERQNEVINRISQAVSAQAAALSAAAEKIISDRPSEPVRFQPMSAAEAILRYAGDFVPSWAGAISIDLLPAVLVLILCVVHASIRREGVPLSRSNTMTTGDLITALRLARELDEAHANTRGRLPGEERRHGARDLVPQRESRELVPVRDTDENVTTLATALAAVRGGKKD